MKRLLTPLAIGFATLALLLLAPSGRALAQQQTFSSVSSGHAPAPWPTPTSMNVSDSYLGIYPMFGWNHHPHAPCTSGHCPVKPVHPPVGTRPVPPPRPAPPRP